MRTFVTSICLLSLAACATDRAGTPRSCGHVYMFRGLVDILSLGVDDFSRELREAGFESTAYTDAWGPAIAARIERDYAKRGKHEPLVLIGYSSGVVPAVAIAKRLNQSHIPVDLLVTLDPAVSQTAPANVRSCVNYYERIIPGVLFLSGTKMRAEPGVQLENIRLSGLLVNHFTVDQNREMRAAVIARISSLCSNRGLGVPPNR